MIWLILTVVVVAAAVGVGAYFFTTGLYRIFVPIGVAAAWVILTLALSPSHSRPATGRDRAVVFRHDCWTVFAARAL